MSTYILVVRARSVGAVGAALHVVSRRNALRADGVVGAPLLRGVSAGA